MSGRERKGASEKEGQPCKCVCSLLMSVHGRCICCIRFVRSLSPSLAMSAAAAHSADASAIGETIVDAASASVPRKENRLPADVKPIHYALSLTPDLVACNFSGAVEIDITTQLDTSCIKINAVELKIQQAVIISGEKCMEASRIELNEEDEIASFFFPSPILPGQHVLSLIFTGILNDQMRGFYASKYEDAQGVSQVMATTQFEATDCRRCLPCFDEPAVKVNNNTHTCDRETNGERHARSCVRHSLTLSIYLSLSCSLSRSFVFFFFLFFFFRVCLLQGHIHRDAHRTVRTHRTQQYASRGGSGDGRGISQACVR